MRPTAIVIILWASSVALAEMPTFDRGPRPKTFPELRAYYADRGLQISHKKISTPEHVKQTNDINYASRAGRQLHVDLFVPQQLNDTRAIVILVHGGGWKKGSRTGEHTKAAWLSERGFVAVCPEYRLSGEALFPAAIHDVKDAIRWTREHATAWGADPNRIVLMGFSAGAHLVALAATAGPEANLEAPDASATSSQVAACIPVAGPTITNDEKAFENARKPDSNYLRFLGGLPEDVPQRYEQASPAHWVSGNEPPMLFISEGNPEVNDAIREKLTAQSIRNEIFNLTGGIHSEWNWEPWFTPTMERTEEFIRSVFHN